MGMVRATIAGGLSAAGCGGHSLRLRAMATRDVSPPPKLDGRSSKLWDMLTASSSSRARRWRSLTDHSISNIGT